MHGKDGWRDFIFLFFCLRAHKCMFHIWRLQSTEMKQSAFSLYLFFILCHKGQKYCYDIFFFFSALLTLNMIWTQLKWLMGNNPVFPWLCGIRLLGFITICVFVWVILLCCSVIGFLTGFHVGLKGQHLKSHVWFQVCKPFMHFHALSYMQLQYCSWFDFQSF